MKEDIKKRTKPSIGYIEVMNNGRYWVSCGDESEVDKYWYATADSEREAIDLLMEDSDELNDLPVIPELTEIIILKDWMFGARKSDINSCIERVISFFDEDSD